MKLPTQSQEHINSSELRKSFSADCPRSTNQHTKSQHSNSSHTLQKSNRQKKTDSYLQDQRKETTTGQGSPTKQKKSWYKKQWTNHGENNKRSQTSMGSQSNNSGQSSTNTTCQTDKYRRIVAHRKVDIVRKRHVQQRERMVKNVNRRWYAYIPHPRTQMYHHIAEKMWIHIKDCHFKKFNAKQCQKAIQIAKSFVYSNTPTHE